MLKELFLCEFFNYMSSWTRKEFNLNSSSDRAITSWNCKDKCHLIRANHQARRSGEIIHARRGASFRHPLTVNTTIACVPRKREGGKQMDNSGCFIPLNKCSCKYITSSQKLDFCFETDIVTNIFRTFLGYIWLSKNVLLRYSEAGWWIQVIGDTMTGLVNQTTIPKFIICLYNRLNTIWFCNSLQPSLNYSHLKLYKHNCYLFV